MSKLTLLQVVQSTLASMDSDDVNSIDDTEEALQVAKVAEEVYFEIMSQKDWPHLKEIRELEGLADSTKPNFLRIPDDIAEIKKVKYDTTDSTINFTRIAEIAYAAPEAFIDLVHTRRTDNSNVITVTTTTGVPLFIIDDKSPVCWTSFDDEEIVFDAYNKAVDTTLQGSKSVILAVRVPTFSQTDTFTPDMPESMFPLYLAEVKRTCHLYFKQQDSALDAKRSLRGMNRMKIESWRAHDPKKKVDFGRRRSQSQSRIQR